MTANVEEVNHQRITDFLLEEFGEYLQAVMLHRGRQVTKLYVNDEWSGVRSETELDAFIENLRAQVEAMVDINPNFSLPAHMIQGTQEQRVAYILSDTGVGVFFCLTITPGDGPKCGYVLEECVSYLEDS